MDKKMFKNLIVIAISMLTAIFTLGFIERVISGWGSVDSINLILYTILSYSQNLFVLRVLYLAFVKEKAMSKQWMVVGLVLMLLNVLSSSIIYSIEVEEFKNAVMIISIVLVMVKYIRNKSIHVGNFLFIMLLLALVYVELQIIAQQIDSVHRASAMDTAAYIVNINMFIESIKPLILMIIIVAYISGNKKICTYTVAMFTISLVTCGILMFIFAELFIQRLYLISSIFVYIPYVLLASGILLSWRQDDRL